MASGKWSVRHVLAVWSTFICTCLVITAPGVGALRFLNDPKRLLVGHFGYNVDFNCTTDDPNATVSLLHSPGFGPLTERPLTPGKLILNGQVFTLINLVISDGGMYACKATNESGQSIQWPFGMGRLLLSQSNLPEHFVLIPSKAIIVLQGKSESVTCESEGVSVVTLKWEKQTDSGSYVEVPAGWVTVIKDTSANMIRAVLKITNAKLADAGVYKCTVAIRNKSTSKLMTIRVDAPGPPTIEPYTGKTVIKEGEENILRCVAKGSPKPDVTWYRDGKRLNTTDCKNDPMSCENILYEVYEQGDASPLHTTYTDGVLKIRKALYPIDDGEFKCIASNGNLPNAELTIDLDVQVPPKIHHQINQHVAQEGKETEVFCVIEKGNPLPTFKWQYQPLDCPGGKTDCPPEESKWVAVPTRLMVTPTATPTNKSIVKVEKDEANTFYLCQASNSLGNDSQVVKLIRTAKDKPMIELDVKNTKTEFDESSTLSVYWIDRCFGFCPLVFSKDNKTFSSGDDPRINITHEQYDRVVLTIKNLTLNDSGSYGCALQINPTDIADVSIVIKKLIAPNITGLYDKVVVQSYGVHVTLNCDATGHPKPAITWYFDQSGKDKGERVIKDIGAGLRGNTDNCDQRRSGYFYLYENVPDKIVICSADFEKHQGKYLCNARNTAGSMDKYARLTIQRAPLIIEPAEGYKPPFLKIGDSLNVTCKAKGNPPPNVTWIKNSTGMIVATSQTNSKQLVIKSMKEEDFGVYNCVASNKLERTVVSIEVEELKAPVARKDQGLSTSALVGIGAGVGVFVLILLVVCCVLYRRQKKQIDEYKQLYFLQQSDYKIDPDRSLLEQCNDLPYDPDWEFPEERLILGNILGAGAFGQVVQAEAIGILALNPRDKSAESFKRRSKIRRSSRAKDLKKEEGNGGWKNVKIPVAVKTLKEGATQAEYKDLASELKILIHLGQHKNIVNLLGACTRGKRLMVIMEFAPHGSLLSFLRGKRETYEASWTKTMNDPEKEFTLVDLVMIGFQVGRGMSFLASKKCVHRDLAARNILVGEDYVMKIADFGLARDIYKDDLYVKKTQGLLPVKWMAPESLFDRIYTEKTDVWSFGVLLWETFTLGGSPYPGLPTEQLLDYLSEGKRMDMPAKCPLEVYTIMRDCWIHEDEQRPHFTTLTERLAKILEKNTSKENPYLALQMEEEAEPTQGYYMQPCDDAGIRESKRYVKSPVQSPSSDSKEPPNFKDAANAMGDGMGYDSPLPTLPPGLPVMSDEDIPNEPLPPIPPSYDSATRTDSAGGESGIDMDGADDGYVDDVRVDSPFLPPPGNKPVALDMDNIMKTPEAKVHGRKAKYETQL